TIEQTGCHGWGKRNAAESAGSAGYGKEEVDSRCNESLQSSARLPSDAAQIANTARDHGNPFSHQQRAFQPFVPAVAAKTAARGNDAMPRDIRSAPSAHDVADCPCRARPARPPRDVPVTRD